MRKPRQLYHDSDNMQWSGLNVSRTPDGNIIIKDGEAYSAQRDFLTSKSKYILCWGGFGSGKTHVFIRRALALLVNTPWFGDMSGNVGCLGRYTLTEFMKTTLPELWKCLPGGKRSPWIRKFYKKDNLIEFANESVLYLEHFDEIDHLQSHNFGFVGIDQMEQISWEVFKALAYERIRNRVLIRYNENNIQITPQFDLDGNCISTDQREKDAVLDYQCVFGVCNPKRNWLYNKFVKNDSYKNSDVPQVRAKYNPLYHLVVMTTYDNLPNLPPDYIENQRKDKSDREFRRSVLGSADAFEGQIYEDFTDDLILKKDKMPSPLSEIYVGVDHGGSGTPTANFSTNVTDIVFFALIKRENLLPKIHIFKNLFLPSSTIEETVDVVYETLKTIFEVWKFQFPDLMSSPFFLSQNIAIPTAWRCDPNMAKHMDDSDESFIQSYMRHAVAKGFNMPLVPGGSGLQERQHKVNWMFRKKLVEVNPSLVEFIESFRNYEYGNNEKPKANQNDHAVNAFEYGVTAIPLWFKGIRPEIQQKSFVERIMGNMKNIIKQGNDAVYGDRYASIR